MRRRSPGPWPGPGPGDRSRQGVSAVGPFERAVLDERTDHLLEEERIAGRPFRKRLHQGAAGHGLAQQAGDHRAHLLGGEGRQRQLAVVGVAHPAGVELGTEVRDDKSPRARIRLDQLLEESRTRIVEPVQILEQEDQGHALASARCHPSDQLEDPAHSLLRGDRREGVFRISNLHEIEEDGKVALDRRAQRHQPLGDLLPCLLRRVRVDDLEVVAEELQHRPQRHVLAV